MKSASLLALCLMCGCCTEPRLVHSKIEMFSGGQKVREWNTSSRVRRSHNASNYYWTDETGERFRIYGDVIITETYESR